MLSSPGVRRCTRQLTAALLAASMLTATAGCADDAPVALPSGAGPSAQASTTPSPDAEAFPLTIRQTAGDVTIPAAPERVVALDFPSADAAIALGVVPVAMAELSYIPGGVQEWTKQALAGATPELIETEQGFPFETLLRLDPDVILATNTFPLVEDSWAKLNEIAPVVAHIDKPGLDEWQGGFRKVAQALGKAAEGDRLIAEADTAVEAARAAHPEFTDATASFFNYGESFGLYVINSNTDVSMRFMRDLGFAGAPPQVLALPSEAGGEGRAVVSAERYDLLEADVILGTTSEANQAVLDDLRETDLFARVPAVARGGFLGLNIGPATAMAFPSVLSVPYAIGELLDPLSVAVRAGRTPAPAPAAS
ncbi:MAG: ABC transporter substrate-binding protein [Sporichthyaceae bacterium]